MSDTLQRLEVSVVTKEVLYIDLTPEEISLGESVKQQESLTEYKRLRVAEYPPISDYIDGVVKGDQTQVDTYIQACLAVKEKYPKPVIL